MRYGGGMGGLTGPVRSERQGAEQGQERRTGAHGRGTGGGREALFGGCAEGRAAVGHTGADVLGGGGGGSNRVRRKRMLGAWGMEGGGRGRGALLRGCAKRRTTGARGRGTGVGEEEEGGGAEPCAPGMPAASGARGGASGVGEREAACWPYPRLRLTGGGRGCFVTSHLWLSRSRW